MPRYRIQVFSFNINRWIVWGTTNYAWVARAMWTDFEYRNGFVTRIVEAH